MPQFDIATAAPQIIWLALIFALLYLLVSSMLPKVERVVESRKQTIAADLLEAEAARAAALGASEGGSSALSDARAAAMTVTGNAREKANLASSARIAEVDAALHASGEAAAAALASTREAISAELEQVAADATVDLVRRVAGVQVASDEAWTALKKVA